MIRVETIGNATLYLADCAEVIPSLQPVDLLLSDPPYGLGESSRDHKSRNRVRGGKAIISTDYGSDAWDDEPPCAAQIALCVGAAKYSILWGGNFFGLAAASKWLVWDKENSGDFADCELAWTNLPGAVRIFRHMWNGMLRASERNSPRVHPTQKPIALMDWCIDQAGDVSTVFDPYMGSGTTGVSCANLGKSFIGIEREPRYFDIACERIAAAQSQVRLFV
jgi:site-specific DNA-methyltransferase (adenine-specific)/modification methylase